MSGGDAAGVPWLWIVYDAADPDNETAVRARGEQHTHLRASADAVAAERMADLAYRALRADRLESVGSLVCRVKRRGAERWEGTARGSAWVRPSGRARR